MEREGRRKKKKEKDRSNRTEENLRTCFLCRHKRNIRHKVNTLFLLKRFKVYFTVCVQLLVPPVNMDV